MTDDAHEENTNNSPPINERGRAYDPDAPDSERTYACMIHLSLLAHIFLSLIAIIIPIIMWVVKKDESPFVDDHGREAVNFQISLIIWSFIFAIVGTIVGILTCGVGFILFLVPYILGLIGMIQAAMAANKGEFYRYPMTFRFLH